MAMLTCRSTRNRCKIFAFRNVKYFFEGQIKLLLRSRTTLLTVRDLIGHSTPHLKYIESDKTEIILATHILDIWKANISLDGYQIYGIVDLNFRDI